MTKAQINDYRALIATGVQSVSVNPKAMLNLFRKLEEQRSDIKALRGILAKRGANLSALDHSIYLLNCVRRRVEGAK